MRKIGYRQGGSTISKRIIQKIKDIIDFLSDRKILLGIGIGLILGVIFMFIYKYETTISDYSIEEKARGLGMHYEGECKTLFGKDDEK